MCVLAPVRNFRFLCFEGVTGNSIGSAVSIRSGRPLAHSEVTTGSILALSEPRDIANFLPRTAGTHPPKSPPPRAGTLSLWPRLSGHKNIIRIFWVKLFVARFWRNFKEWEAVCVNFFCKGVPFWE